MLDATDPPEGAADGRVVTVSGWLEYWLATRSAQRESTLRGYRSHVRLYLTPYLGRITLAEMTAAQVQAMFLALARLPGGDGEPMTGGSLARIRATLTRGFHGGVDGGVLMG